MVTYSWKNLIDGEILSDCTEFNVYAFMIINVLPELPQTLKKIDCRTNKLNELPELPQTLEIFILW